MYNRAKNQVINKIEQRIEQSYAMQGLIMFFAFFMMVWTILLVAGIEE